MRAQEGLQSIQSQLQATSLASGLDQVSKLANSAFSVEQPSAPPAAANGYPGVRASSADAEQRTRHAGPSGGDVDTHVHDVDLAASPEVRAAQPAARHASLATADPSASQDGAAERSALLARLALLESTATEALAELEDAKDAAEAAARERDAAVTAAEIARDDAEALAARLSNGADEAAALAQRAAALQEAAQSLQASHAAVRTLGPAEVPARGELS